MLACLLAPLSLCRERGVAGGTAVARSAWSETSFPFLLMLPRGPKEAYLRAPLPPTRRPAGRPVGGGRLHRFPRSAESGRRGVREGGSEGGSGQSKLRPSPLVFGCTRGLRLLSYFLSPALVSLRPPGRYDRLPPPPVPPPFHSVSFRCEEGETEMPTTDGRRDGGTAGG